MGRFKTFLLSAIAVLVVFVANAGASITCFYGWYEPEVPQSLRK
ncbi:MAG: cyclic lactone autoinducer peptide [Clostridia bacterium]|nr:cyclic lactone autoinducer peptide [Clostridia bacterium]